MSIEMKAKCDRCGKEVKTEERLPMGWADVRFRFQYPENLSDADKRKIYHACDECVSGLYDFMFPQSLPPVKITVQGVLAEGERR